MFKGENVCLKIAIKLVESEKVWKITLMDS